MAKTDVPTRSFEPINGDKAGLIYNLIFCDDIELYKEFVTDPDIYPWNILFSENANTADLLKIANDARNLLTIYPAITNSLDKRTTS